MNPDSCTRRFNPPRNVSRLRFYFRIFLIAAFLIVLAVWLDYWLRGEIGIAKKFAEFVEGQWGTGALIGGGIIYVLLLSLPFVPGVELGVLLMCVFGKTGIVFVYFATVAGLSLAFLMGRLLPKEWIESRLHKLGFSQTCDNSGDEIDEMLDNLSRNRKFCQSRLGSFLTKYRYLTIAVLFNMPGNYLIGGGGGISLACGISSGIPWKWFLLTVVLAVSPVPLLAYFGVIHMEAFLGIPKTYSAPTIANRKDFRLRFRVAKNRSPPGLTSILQAAITDAGSGTCSSSSRQATTSNRSGWVSANCSAVAC